MSLFHEDDENLSLEATIENSRDFIEVGFERDHAEGIARELVETVRRTLDVLGVFPREEGFEWVGVEGGERKREGRGRGPCVRMAMRGRGG